jgi:predicted  nucleic acid-binding Zn-ribbon protein
MVEKYNQSVAKKKFERLNATERNAVQIALSQIQDTLRKTRNRLIELDIRDEDLDDAVMDLNLAISDLLNQAKTASNSLERLR